MPTINPNHLRVPCAQSTRHVGALFLCLLCLLLTLLAPAHAARLALVIGNDQYSNIERLKNAKNDAKLISGVLQKAGFEVTQASDLGREQFWKAIDNFKGRINKGDEVVFYFAGHGVQIGANQLLLATDIKGQNEAEVQRDGVPLVDVQEALKDARIAVLIIDACRDNPFPKQGTRSVGGTRGLSPPEPSTGQIIMMSAGRNQKALDSVPGQSIANGLFTWELAQLLQTPGLEIRVALEQVKDRVDDKARQANHQQRPSVVSDLRGNFFFIAPGANVTIQVSPAPVAAPTPAVRPASTDPDTALWNAVETGGTADDYGVYVKQYPKGKFVALAKQRLQKLQSEAANASIAAEESAWQSAESGGTETGYQSYLASYPQGRYAALAQPRMNKLKVQAAERERLAAEQRQREQAQAAQREEAARAKLKAIKEEEAKRALTQSSTSFKVHSFADGQEQKIIDAVRAGNFSIDRSIMVIAPDIAENGAVVPVGASVDREFKNGERLFIIVNDSYIGASLTPYDSRAKIHLSVRVKMQATGTVKAVLVDSSGRLSLASKEVKVTLGADPNIIYGTSTLSANMRMRVEVKGDILVRTLLDASQAPDLYIKSASYILNGTKILEVGLTPGSSKNPFIQVKMGSSGGSVQLVEFQGKGSNGQSITGSANAN